MMKEGSVVEKFTKETCIELLCAKAKELEENGESRYPKKADFSEEQAAAVKSFLGPWPRALEAAGLKPEDPERLEKKKQKRIASKRAKTAAKIQQKAVGKEKKEN